mmetsp:Transcript_17856/g.35989  ORF Transcript_17856/g.35989 Transcript_17856/m.35989 type:complete len:137 (+) Transcript_17856:4800-5210(+)
MADALRKLVNYFSMFDGNHNWAAINTTATALAHPDFTIHTPSGQVDRDAWMASIESFAKNGGTIDMLYFEAIEGPGDVQVKYKLRMNMVDGTTSLVRSIGTFKDGMLFHVEPMEGASAYDKIFHDANPSSKVAVEQ